MIKDRNDKSYVGDVEGEGPVYACVEEGCLKEALDEGMNHSHAKRPYLIWRRVDVPRGVAEDSTRQTDDVGGVDEGV